MGSHGIDGLRGAGWPGSMATREHFDAESECVGPGGFVVRG